MSTPILKSSQQFIKGEVKNLAFKFWDEANPNNDVSSSTVTIALYDRLGALTSAFAAAALTGTTLVTASRLLDSSAIAAGKYKALGKVVYGTITQYFQWPVEVLPLPAP